MVRSEPSSTKSPTMMRLTPKHRESDTHVHRGRITKQGSRLVRWAAIESVKRLGPHTGVGPLRERVAIKRGPEHRHRRGRSPPGRARLLRPARRARARPDPPGAA
ncbi:hypothetical protein GCM10023168_28840 [Fodinibacter luteus]|uniref:Uncharacterized protein n=1 Tax=Fodinibacter luteus TaxID=552064 RepID=A0ABP8KMC0_9MICO